MQIKNIMTQNVSVARPGTGIAEIARKMRDEDIGSMPVVENERLIGMVTDRDLVIRVLATEQDLRVVTARDAMSPNVMHCFDDQQVEEVLANMGAMQVRRVPVIDRDKRLVGVVSLGDLSKAAAYEAGGALGKISRPSRHWRPSRH